MAENLKKPEFPCEKENVAAIDIASEFHVVAIQRERSENPVRTFPAHSDGLRDMVVFLKDHGIVEAAMESTGNYWVPVFNILEENGIKPVLLNPRTVKILPGRKSDVKDAEWILKVYSHGFVRPCHIPPHDVAKLRELVRARETQVKNAAKLTNLMIKELRFMNINLEKAVTDVQGETGMKIINAIAYGERDPNKLAALRDKRCKKSEKEISQHLDGIYCDVHIFNLRVHLCDYDHAQSNIKLYDTKIFEALERFPSADPNYVRPDDPKPEKPEKPKKRPTTAQYRRLWGEKVRSEVARIIGTDLTLIEGVGPGTALVIMSEIGSNVEAFPSPSHFSSWMGLCPASNISGGKILGRSTRKVQNRVAQALRMCARSLHRSSSFLGGFYKKMKARQGPQQANVSTAHKIARLIYSLMKNGAEYVAKSMEIAEAKQKAYLVSVATKKAEKLGLCVLRPGDPLFEEASRAAALRGPAEGGCAA